MSFSYMVFVSHYSLFGPFFQKDCASLHVLSICSMTLGTVRLIDSLISAGDRGQVPL